MAFTERYVTQGAAGGGSGTAGSPWTFAEAVTNHVAGDRINVKDDGTDYTLGTTTLSVSSTNAALVHWRGYATTIGDAGKPTLAVTVQLTVSAEAIKLESLAFTMNANDQVIVSTGGNNTFLLVGMTNTSTNGYGITLAGEDRVVACNISTPNALTSRVAVTTSQWNLILKSTIKTSGIGVQVNGYSNCEVRDCVFIGVGATAVAGIDVADQSLGTGYGIHCEGNTIYNFDDGILCDKGAQFDGTRGQQIIANNVIYTCGHGVRVATAGNNARWLISNNFIGNATTARYSGLGDAVLHGDVTLTSSPFVDAAGGDFGLNEVAGGGALVRNAGLEAPAPL